MAPTLRKQIRELHSVRFQNPEDRMEPQCAGCYVSDDDWHIWPCATARLVYTDKEITAVQDEYPTITIADGILTYGLFSSSCEQVKVVQFTFAKPLHPVQLETMLEVALHDATEGLSGYGWELREVASNG